MKISSTLILGGILLSAVLIAVAAPPETGTEPPSGVTKPTGSLASRGPAAPEQQSPAAPPQDVWRLDRSRPITYFIEDGSPESGFKEADRTLAEWALRAWASQADPAVDLAPGPEATATIRVYWVTAGGGLYGEMRGRMVDGRLAADVFVHPDTEALGLDIAQRARLDPLFRDTVVYLTCVHELGHAFGLAHTADFADIMYSFQYGGDFVAYFQRFREQLEVWDDIERASPFSRGDIGVFRALYP